MLKSKLLLPLIASAALAGLGGCASTAPADGARHDHNRDAKQGYAAPYTPSQARKPLHNHREMK